MYNFTPSEMFFARKFANDVAGNIDENDFKDSRNVSRTQSKVIEDNIKGKLAEILVYNLIGNKDAEMDFNIYEKGIGDGFDIVVNGLSIDVKASTMRSKWLMFEERTAKGWAKPPDYMCLVGIEGDKGEYLFGSDIKTIRKNCQLIERGSNIPNTQVPMKASNFMVNKASSFDSSHIVQYFNQGEK